MSSQEDAKVQIFASKPDGGTSGFEAPISPLVEVQLGPWTVRLDKFLLNKLIACRKAKLPNETGGVLLGHFDTQRRICSIIDVVESPPDSGKSGQQVISVGASGFKNGCGKLKD